MFGVEIRIFKVKESIYYFKPSTTGVPNFVNFAAKLTEIIKFKKCYQ